MYVIYIFKTFIFPLPSLCLFSTPNSDLEDLLGQLAEDEVQNLLDEMASDPDDVHLPASVRNSYRCNKASTGDLNRDSLINHINEEGR